MIRQCTFVAVMLLASLALVPDPARAQIQTQVEREIGAAQQEAQDRRDAARARDAQERAKGQSSSPGLSPADIARIQAENSRARAEENRKHVEMDAYVAAAAQRRTDFIGDEQKKIWLSEVAELQAHPAPVAAPGSYTECDRLASKDNDETRPLGLEAPQTVNIAAALLACRAEVTRAPQSARAQYELGRTMLASLSMAAPPEAFTCSQAIDALRRAEALGSSAAAFTLGTYSPTDCSVREVMARDKIELRKAVDMGNPDAGFVLGAIFSVERNNPNLNATQKTERTNAMKFMWKYTVGLYATRAMAGDMYAIYSLAQMADDKTMAYWTFDYVQEPARWVYKCQARNYKPCAAFTPKTS